MQQWRVGEVDIVRIEAFDVALPSDPPLPDWMVPTFGPSTSEYHLVDSATAVRDGDIRVVVDPWLITARPDASAADASSEPDRLLGALADAGFPADEVDFVVNTHLEGLGWNTVPDDGEWALAFPNATYLYPVEDVAWAESEAGAADNDAADLRHLGSLTSITAVDDVVALTSSVSVVPSGGHGRCHQVVRIESGGDLAVHLGHLILQPVQFADPTITSDEDDPHELPVRRALLDDVADHGGLVLTDLVGGPGGGRLTHDGDGYRV